MSAQLVPTVRTTYSNYDLIKGFVEGWKKQFGVFPQKASIAVLYAQTAIETGSTGSMWNNNIGNVKYIPSKDTTADEGVQYMMLNNVWEILGGKKVIFQPPHQATWFRSFPTLADGFAFQVDFLKNKRYKKAWQAVEDGSPTGFAHLLKLAGYYTAPEADYAKAVGIYFNKFMKDDSFEKIVIGLTTTEPVEASTPVEEPVVVPIVEAPSAASQPPSTVVVMPVALSPWASVIQFFAGLFGKK
jgi:flagellar protein FlgJ